MRSHETPRTVHVVGSPNSKQLSGDAGNGSKESKQPAALAKTNGTRSLGTHISKISGAITRVHKGVRLKQNLLNEGFIPWYTFYGIRSTCSMWNKITILSVSDEKDLLTLIVIGM